MKLVIASDHGGFRLKEEVKAHLTEKGIEFTDYGTHTPERCDYPLIAEKAAPAGAGGGPFEGPPSEPLIRVFWFAARVSVSGLQLIRYTVFVQPCAAIRIQQNLLDAITMPIS